MLFKRFAELDFPGPTPKPSKVSASLSKWVLDRNAQQGGGHELYFRRDSIIGNHGREAFAYLSFRLFYVMLATFLRQYFFFNGKP